MDRTHAGPDASPSGPATPLPDGLSAEARSGSRAGRPGDPSASASLLWPPPGLARIQGDAWWISRKLTVGGLILVVPLLLTMAARDPFELGGALGDAWWIASVTTLIGAILLGFAVRDAGRLFGRGARAMRQGHGARTLALVAADRGRDMGFVLQGDRHYSVLAPSARRAIALGRITASAMLLAGSLWIPVGFGLALLLGTRGALAGPLSVLAWTLIPYVAAILGTAVLLLWEQTTVRRARRAWHRRPWSEDLEEGAIREWARSFQGRVDPAVATPGTTEASRGASLARWAIYASGAGAVVVALVLAGVMSLASVLTSLSVPVFGTPTLSRMADVEPLRRYVIEPEGVDPQEAGEILQVLLAVGPEPDTRPGLRAPVRSHSAPWFPDEVRAADPEGLLHPASSANLLDRAAAGLEPAEMETLRAAVGHPAAAEISRLARAGSVDVVHGRFDDPLPVGMQTLGLPVPRYRGLRAEGVSHHLLEATLLAAEGRTDEAEIRVREVISVGLLLADHGPYLIDNLVGTSIAAQGGDALERLFRGTGRQAEADDLAWARSSAVRAVERAGFRMPPGSAQGLRDMRRLVAEPLSPPGLRWEMFTALNTVSPCLNLDRIVFGGGGEHREWIEASRAALVRWPSEERIFELVRNGHFATVGGEGPAYLPLRPVLWLVGRTGQPESCGALIARMAQGV